MITKPRFAYKVNGVFEYPKAEEFCEKQQNVHWLKSEIALNGDVKDWNSKLTDSEKHLIGQVLKGFTQTETLVNDYWTQLVTKWFPKPEIIGMATTFGSFEVVHMQSYSMLNQELGLDDFEAFMEDETTSAKLEALMDVKNTDINPKGFFRKLKRFLNKNVAQPLNWKWLKKVTRDKTLEEIARSLAVFSAFAEGVNLFSSFAILMSFSRRNLLKGVGQIVAFSVR